MGFPWYDRVILNVDMNYVVNDIEEDENTYGRHSVDFVSYAGVILKM